MATFLDSGLYFGLITKKDVHHLDAERLLREYAEGKHGMLYTSNFILNEAMSLITFRIGLRSDLLEKMKSFFIGPRKIAIMIDIPMEWLDEIATLQVKLCRDGTEASFTDCSSIIACQKQEIGKIVSFDGHFEGFLEQLR